MSDYFSELGIQANRPAPSRGDISQAMAGFFNGQSSSISQIDPVNGALSQIPDDFIDQLRQAAARYSEDGVKSGVDQKFLDGLDRISNKKLKPTDECAICATAFLDQDYPLVVRLPCNSKHQFDMDCIAPWLKENSTCPMCRKDFNKKKVIEQEPDSEDEDPFDSMYG